jgi:flagellar motor switch protein FliG
VEVENNGLIKTINAEKNVTRIAKFLLLLGKEEAANILKHLNEKEIEKIAYEIASIKRVDNREASKVLTEFGFTLKARRVPLAGGRDIAQDILIKAFGEKTGNELFFRAVPEAVHHIFDFLNDLEPQQLNTLIKTESPAVISVVLPYLDRKIASAVLKKLDVEIQNQVIKRIGHMEKIGREVLLKIEEAFREKIRNSGKTDFEEIDGKGVLADILKYSDVGVEQGIIEKLHDEDPELSGQIKERLFTISSIELLDDRQVQEILRNFDDVELAMLLKGKEESYRTKILSNLSQTRREIVAEEYSHLGAVPKKDVDRVTKDFIIHIRRLEEEGKIVVPRQDEMLI